MSRPSSFRQWTYYANWFLKSKLGIKKPLVNTMIIHYACNLRCQHCSLVANANLLPEPKSISFQSASEEMKGAFEKGARILFFEGGEPTIWKDGDNDLSSLIEEGRRIGYYVVGYTTNATGMIFKQSDVISVSVDGPRQVHDLIRGPGTYDLMMENLKKTNHPNIFANMVIMKPNMHVVRQTVEEVSKNPRIKGIMLNFITPPPQELALTLDEKKRILDEALRMKEEGLPILNTNNGLEELLIEDYSDKCPYWVSGFVLPDGSKFLGCPMKGSEACRQCGFDAVREYRLITTGDVETIMQMSKRFALSRPE